MVGRSVPLLDSEARVTGAVEYLANIKVPGALVGRVFRSEVPHALLRRVDVAAAEQLPGVVAIVTAADFDQPGGPGLSQPGMIRDQPVLASDRVRYVGEPIALVAAESDEAAEAAMALIDVDYEELPAVYDEVEAAAPGAPLTHEDRDDNVFVHGKIRHGDVEAGFAQADEIIEETYYSPVAQQSSLEVHGSIAQWADHRLTVWTASQGPHQVRGALASIFGVPPEDVRVVVPPLGGGYGGKLGLRVEQFAAVLAWKAGRPVRVVLSRAEEFVTVTKHAATITIKTGVKRDGSFTARQVTMYWNAGAYSEGSAGLVRGALVRSVGAYRVPAVWVDSFGVYTNLPSAGAYRGAMSSQTTWTTEGHMDTIAGRLGIDPLELRRRNVLRSGDHFATGEELHDVHFEDCLEAVVAGLGWDEPPEPPRGTVRTGRGVAVMMNSTVQVSRSECRLTFDNQGQLVVYTSGVEMGQGAHTALAQIASDAMSVPLDQIRVQGPDTEQTPFDTNTFASRLTHMMGSALLDAAAKLKDELAQHGSAILDVPPEQVAVADGFVTPATAPAPRLGYAEVLERAGVEQLEATGEFAAEAKLDPETGQGIGSPQWHAGAGACEVAVDTETGKVQVLRYVSSSFAGRVINPALANLQNDGNVIYGLGPTLLEEMVFDGGQVINRNLSDYMLPSFKDIPRELTNVSLEADGSEVHGIGEMTLPPVAPAVANAIFDAVGVRIRDLPITAEKVLRGLVE